MMSNLNVGVEVVSVAEIGLFHSRLAEKVAFILCDTITSHPNILTRTYHARAMSFVSSTSKLAFFGIQCTLT